jgi:phycobilisome rod-core linker protein
VAIPLLSYAPTAPNSRVEGFDVANDDQPRIFSTDNLLSSSDMGALIDAAYRQIFFHAFKSDREPYLESQLRNGQISVRQFIRGLLLSDTYTKSFYDLNSNYRFVEHCVQRVLGRDVYSKQEKIAWSIVVATQGRAGFVDALLDSDEYLENFGDSIVPYQRRRVLASGATKTPFNIQSPRYDEYYRRQLGFPQTIFQNVIRSYKPQDQQARAGDPAAFLNMALSINPVVTTTPQSALNVDYLSAVPRR